mgnify:FL=1
MGSGETSPTMVTAHQQILRDVPRDSGSAIFLDTPFGFQENADELTSRIADYFAGSVGREIEPVSLRTSEEPPAVSARAIDAVRHANWIFAGPGSPTYALRTWKESGMSAHLGSVLEQGSLIFASAAALTIGSHTIPVYEIYKVGQSPHWLDGLNILEQFTGLRAAVIPHFDNAEGGTHDTRFCYIGQRRLEVMENMLPDDVFILGVDEHTGASFDLETGEVLVFGRGAMTIKNGEAQMVVRSGQATTIEGIIEFTQTKRAPMNHEHQEFVQADVVEHLLEQGNVTEAVDALLQLDELDRDLETRATVHALITRLGQIAASPRVDINQVVSPYIEALLEARQMARAGGRWDEADLIRNQLTELKVTIKDTADGSTWEIEST